MDWLLLMRILSDLHFSFVFGNFSGSFYDFLFIHIFQLYFSVSRFDTSFCFSSLITQRVFSVWTLVCFFSSGLFFSHQVFKYCISATAPIFLGWSTYWHLCLPFTFHIVQLLLHICFCPFLFLLMLIPGWICKCYFSIYYLFSEGLDLS